MDREDLARAVSAAGRWADNGMSLEQFIENLVNELRHPHACVADYTRTWCVVCGTRMGA